jgi:hypothetical protein
VSVPLLHRTAKPPIPVEGRPQGDERHLLTDEGSEGLPALMPEGCPDEAEAGDGPASVDFFALPVGGFFWTA